ncbi:cysteine hydrolase family protein [soil metagenome]
MKSALLIIDVQEALCTGEWAMFDIERVLDTVNGLSARARAAGVPVVLVQHEEDEGSMQFGSDGWQLAKGLSVSAADARVRKKTPNSFLRTDLQTLLQAKHIERLIVCGLQSDFCVDTTVRQALALGYHVTLAEDAHSTMDNGVLTATQITAHHNTTLEHLTSFGPRVLLLPAAEVTVEA